jgi:hypothetical protein
MASIRDTLLIIGDYVLYISVPLERHISKIETGHGVENIYIYIYKRLLVKHIWAEPYKTIVGLTLFMSCSR